MTLSNAASQTIIQIVCAFVQTAAHVSTLPRRTSGSSAPIRFSTCPMGVRMDVLKDGLHEDIITQGRRSAALRHRNVPGLMMIVGPNTGISITLAIGASA